MSSGTSLWSPPKWKWWLTAPCRARSVKPSASLIPGSPIRWFDFHHEDTKSAKNLCVLYASVVKENIRKMGGKDKSKHDAAILDQFTRQAVPFSRQPAHSQETF